MHDGQRDWRRHLSPEAYRELVAGLIQEIEADAAAERKRTGREALGVEVIVRQHPHTCPNKTKKSPAPRFHAAIKAVREALRKAYGLFLAAFREAAERLKAGDRTAQFPNGCFPPGLPFVRCNAWFGSAYLDCATGPGGATTSSKRFVHTDTSSSSPTSHARILGSFEAWKKYPVTPSYRDHPCDLYTRISPSVKVSRIVWKV